MNTRTVISSSIGVIAALSATCALQRTAAAGDDTSASGMRYEAHVNAGGVAPPASPPPHAPAGNANNAKAGEGLFSSMNCDGCHGGGATGWEGPSLVDGRWRYGGADEEIYQSIFYGRPKGMPAYGGVIGSDGVWMIVSYLTSQPVPSVVPTTNYEEMDAAPAAPASAAAPAPPAASAKPEQKPAVDPRALLAQYSCIACHAIDKKVVGPSFREVAARYRGQKEVEPRLAAKVRNGGGGVWGDVPMTPNAAIPDADLKLVVHWILTSPELK